MPHEMTIADAAFLRLHRAGWSIGDCAYESSGRLIWLVSGSNGENLIRADGSIRSEAWRRALEQAEAVGMAGREAGQDDPWHDRR